MAAISRSADVSASPAVPVATSFIAADVGGTHVRPGHMVQASDAVIALSHYRTYHCAEHASLEAILGDFLQQQRAVDAVVIASAGVALDDGSFLSNTLPWTISPTRRARSCWPPKPVSSRWPARVSKNAHRCNSCYAAGTICRLSTYSPARVCCIWITPCASCMPQHRVIACPPP